MEHEKGEFDPNNSKRQQLSFEDDNVDVSVFEDRQIWKQPEYLRLKPWYMLGVQFYEKSRIYCVCHSSRISQPTTSYV